MSDELEGLTEEELALLREAEAGLTAAEEAALAAAPEVEVDKPKRRRKEAAPAIVASVTPDGYPVEPSEDHPHRLPAQYAHPEGPWGDTPLQSRY